MSPLVPPLAGLGGWLWLHQPLHWIGFTVAVSLGILASVVLPAVVVSARSLPLALIPVQWRIRHRRRREERGLGRPAIPRYLYRATRAADRNRCLYCWHTGILTTEGLQWDHVRPWASGGLTVLWNGATLCAGHNRVKSNYWADRDGYVHYRSFTDADDKALAAAILAVELRARWNPARWVRAGFSLAS